MIGYVTIGTNDLEKASKFYDELLGLLGGKRTIQIDRLIAWNTENGAGLGVAKPFDDKPASNGNGTMVALAASSPEQVKEVYEKALELGATCEGEPGFRDGVPGFYGAYFRDLDGNKLNAFCFVQQ